MGFLDKINYSMIVKSANVLTWHGAARSLGQGFPDYREAAENQPFLADVNEVACL